MTSKADAAGARAESRARSPRFAELDRAIGAAERSKSARRFGKLGAKARWGGHVPVVRAANWQNRRWQYLVRTGRFEDLRKEGFQ